MYNTKIVQQYGEQAAMVPRVREDMKAWGQKGPLKRTWKQVASKSVGSLFPPTAEMRMQTCFVNIMSKTSLLILKLTSYRPILGQEDGLINSQHGTHA